ncbi:MAG: phosphomannomutase [Halodesulfurarchaeum sp.]
MDLFGTAGIRGSAETAVTPALALRVGRAVGADGSEFVVGRDGRETGASLVSAVVAGLLSAGADVRELGMVPTPTLAYASRDRHGVQITASHNPPEDNGIKVFEDGTEYDREAERRIERRVDEDQSPVAWDQWGTRESETVLPDYRQAVIEYVRDRRVPSSHPTAEDRGQAEGRVDIDRADGESTPPLSDHRVVVDCGNGMASLATPSVLESLGAEVVTLNASIDGHFPGRPSKPTPETIEDLRAFLPKHEALLGIAHDGDADRIVIVDSEGDVVHEDTVVAIIAEYYVRSHGARDPVVVTTPNASGRIDERVSAAGGRIERVRLGALHEGIARVQRRGETVAFAAEPWKHIHPELGPWIDGVSSAALLSVLAARAGGLGPLREPVALLPYRKVSVPCPDEAKEPAMDRLAERLPDLYPEASVSTDYGVRLDFADNSWLLVRPSGTEPYLRLYVESEDIDSLLGDVKGHLEDAVSSASS